MVSKLVVLICAVIAGLIGLGIGYYLRFVISLGKKGSMELEIKEMLLAAREEAKKITADAEAKTGQIAEQARKEIKEKEEKNRQTEDRLVKREDLIDKRQSDLDKEVELIKMRVAEIKAIREKADKLEEDRKKELEKISKLSAEEAKDQLVKLIEKQSEEDFLVLMNKLENHGEEMLQRKAQDILAMS